MQELSLCLEEFAIIQYVLSSQKGSRIILLCKYLLLWKQEIISWKVQNVDANNRIIIIHDYHHYVVFMPAYPRICCYNVRIFHQSINFLLKGNFVNFMQKWKCEKNSLEFYWNERYPEAFTETTINQVSAEAEIPRRFSSKSGNWDMWWSFSYTKTESSFLNSLTQCSSRNRLSVNYTKRGQGHNVNDRIIYELNRYTIYPFRSVPTINTDILSGRSSAVRNTSV